DRGDRRILWQVALGGAELGGDEHLLAVGLQRPADHLLAAGSTVVRRGIEVVDSALDGEADDFGIADPGAAERDVRHLDTRRTEPSVLPNPRALPFGVEVLGVGRSFVDEKQVSGVPPRRVDRRTDAGSGGEAGGAG